MTDLELSSVGKTLSSARKKKRLRYKKISSELNIEESYLIALEEERFSFIPGGEPYIKGYLRSYAKKLDLNPDSIVIDYLNSKNRIPEISRDLENINSTISISSYLKHPLVIAILSLIFILFSLVFFQADQDIKIIDAPHLAKKVKSNEVFGILETQAELKQTISADTQSAQQSPTEIYEDITQFDAELKQISDNNVVTIRVYEECWLEVFSEKKRLLYKLSQRGEEYIFNEKSLKIITGNFKNVQVSFNDKIIDLKEYANANSVSCVVLPLGDCSEFRSTNN